MMLAALVVCLLGVRQTLAVISFILTNSTIPPANDTINVSCTDVVFVNVVAQGSGYRAGVTLTFPSVSLVLHRTKAFPV